MAGPEYSQQLHDMDSHMIKNTIFAPNALINAVSSLTTGPLFLFAIIGTIGVLMEPRWHQLRWHQLLFHR
jgi:hypothetical protein